MEMTKVHYDPADAITAKAKNNISAGRFVVAAGEIVGRNPVVDVAAADATPLGVVAHEAKAGEHVTIYRAGHVLDVIAHGTIAAGDKVSTAADGKAAKTGTGPVVAIALTKGAANKPVTVALI